MNHTVIRIASIVVGLAIFILIAFVAFRIIRSRATDTKPVNVTISDVAQNTSKISWTTDQPSIGAVKYGTSEGALNFYAPENVTSPTQNHSVELSLLSPGSMYYFQIQIGENMYDNGGVSWTFSTTSTTSQPVTPATHTSPTIPPATSQTATLSPTPVQHLQIGPTTAPAAVCTETVCSAITAKLGNGCTAVDLQKNNCL